MEAPQQVHHIAQENKKPAERSPTGKKEKRDYLYYISSTGRINMQNCKDMHIEKKTVDRLRKALEVIFSRREGRKITVVIRGTL